MKRILFVLGAVFIVTAVFFSFGTYRYNKQEECIKTHLMKLYGTTEVSNEVYIKALETAPCF